MKPMASSLNKEEPNLKKKQCIKNVQTVVITGMSGSGKSTALKAFEDIGYDCIDNLPIALLPSLLKIKERSTKEPLKLAIVMDLREKSFLDSYQDIFSQVKKQHFHLEVLFLDAQDTVLIRRFNQTRRQHPLIFKAPSLLKSIELERQQLKDIREYADRILDTSDFNVHQLRHQIMELYGARVSLDRLVIHIISFGFKYGVPAESNLVFDVRFLANPYFVPKLKELDGRDARVRAYVLDQKETLEFINKICALLKFLLPFYKKEGKSYLVISIGCTGGRHRSVAIVERLKELLTSLGEEVIVTHRDFEKDN